MTMGHRVNHFMCHSYDLPLEGGKGKNRDEDEKEVEYIKSVIKVAFSLNFLLSGILTDLLLGQYRHRFS